MHAFGERVIAKLVRISPPNNFQGCQDNDLDIQRDAPVVYVPNIEVDPLFHGLNSGRLTAIAADLCPTRDPGLHVMAKGVVADLLGKITVVGSRMWPRPNQRHLPTDNIEQLRQLIDACPSQPCANTRDSPIASHHLLDCRAILDICHCAKLEDLESPAIEAAPRLSEQRIARRIKLDRDRDNDEHRREQHDPAHAKHDIYQSFHESLGQSERSALKLNTN